MPVNDIRHEQIKKRILEGEVGVGKAVKRLTGTLLRASRSSTKRKSGKPKMSAIERAEAKLASLKKRKRASKKTRTAKVKPDNRRRRPQGTVDR